jgi:hypothetical protein
MNARSPMLHLLPTLGSIAIMFVAARYEPSFASLAGIGIGALVAAQLLIFGIGRRTG